MVDGLITYWKDVLATGATLVPILDTPARRAATHPAACRRTSRSSPECVFAKAGARKPSGAPTQLAAARRVPEARVIDMSPVAVPGRASLPCGHRQGAGLPERLAPLRHLRHHRDPGALTRAERRPATAC